MSWTYIPIIRPDAKSVVNWAPFNRLHFFFEVNSNCSLHVLNTEDQHALALKTPFFQDKIKM